jgi:class 3 adenylate cyclase
MRGTHSHSMLPLGAISAVVSQSDRNADRRESADAKSGLGPLVQRVIGGPLHGRAIVLRSAGGVKLCSARRDDAYVFAVEPETQLTSIDVIASALEPGAPALESVADHLRRVSSPDGAITLMLSDIADAGGLAERLGPEGWEQVLRDHHMLVDRIVTHHDGRIERLERDGFLAAFNSAHAGLHAAVELQRTFPGAGDGADGSATVAGGAAGAADVGGPGAGVALRIGLHSGFVMAGPEQLLGRNAGLASRIAAKAKGGEILVSSALKQYTEDEPNVRFKFSGEYHFKGLLGEHTVYSVRWG